MPNEFINQASVRNAKLWLGGASELVNIFVHQEGDAPQFQRGFSECWGPSWTSLLCLGCSFLSLIINCHCKENAFLNSVSPYHELLELRAGHGNP